jgi:hypothetical protein
MAGWSARRSAGARTAPPSFASNAPPRGMAGPAAGMAHPTTRRRDRSREGSSDRAHFSTDVAMQRFRHPAFPRAGRADARTPAADGRAGVLHRLRGQDLNLRPSGYEPDELPDCSTPRRCESGVIVGASLMSTFAASARSSSLFAASRSRFAAVPSRLAAVLPSRSAGYPSRFAGAFPRSVLR